MQHNIQNKNGIYSFNIHHDLGIKWSLYVKRLVSELSVDILEKRQVKITNDLIPWFFDESLLVIIVLFFQYDQEICYYIEYY